MTTKKITSPWDDEMMAPAFWGFVSFASKKLMPQFEAECGKLNLATDPLGAMIDEATGHEAAEVQRFVDWCVVQFDTPEQIYGGDDDK